MAGVVSRARNAHPSIRRSTACSLLFCNQAAHEVCGWPLRLDAPQVVIVLVGFSIVVGAGLTATLCTRSHIYGAAQIVLLYLIWLILAADYAKHPVKTLRLVAIPVVLALVLRHLPVRGARLKPLPKASVGQSSP